MFVEFQGQGVIYKITARKVVGGSWPTLVTLLQGLVRLYVLQAMLCLQTVP